MPLFPGIGKAIREHNIAEMIKAGHPVDQSIAAAYAKQRESKAKEGKDAGKSDTEA